MTVRLGPQTQASVDDPDGCGGLSIALSQSTGSTARWRLSVRATTDEGLLHVGSIVVGPLPASSPPTRVVGMATCPGARNWTVIANLAAGDADDAELTLAVGCCTGVPGLVRVAETYGYYSGVDGALNVPAGETVLGWSAIGDTGGGSVTIAGGSAIIVPEGVGVSGGPGGTLQGPVAFVFTDTTSYYVEVAKSA